MASSLSIIFSVWFNCNVNFKPLTHKIPENLMIISTYKFIWEAYSSFVSGGQLEIAVVGTGAHVLFPISALGTRLVGTWADPVHVARFSVRSSGHQPYCVWKTPVSSVSSMSSASYSLSMPSWIYFPDPWGYGSYEDILFKTESSKASHFLHIVQWGSLYLFPPTVGGGFYDDGYWSVCMAECH